MTARSGAAAAILFGLVACASGCLRPGEDRARLDDSVGVAAVDGLAIDVDEGLAAVRALDLEGPARARVDLWAQAPRVVATLTSADDATLDLTVRNAMAGARLRVERPGAPVLELDAVDDASAPRTRLVFEVPLASGDTRIELVPPDADDPTPWRFAFLADVQTGLDDVGDVFDRINADPSIRFALLGGDATEDGTRSELEKLQTALEGLYVPLYATPGNHELLGDDALWFELFGLRNLGFAHRGARITLIDSSHATLDARVYERLDAWLDAGADAVHILGTHIPPFDPVGVRGGAWRNRREAAALYALLAEHEVDALLAGHIHSYYADSYAGVPTFISGGAGATPAEGWDGIGRHYLAIDVDPRAGSLQVALVRVD